MRTVDVLGSGDDTAHRDGWLGGRRHRGGNRSISEIPVKFMHMFTPVRVMERAKLASGRRARSPRLHCDHLLPRYPRARSGVQRQKVLQHTKLQGRAQVYLMAPFVGEEWETALREAAQR